MVGSFKAPSVFDDDKDLYITSNQDVGTRRTDDADNRWAPKGAEIDGSDSNQMLYKSVTPSLRSSSPTNVKMDAVHPHNLHDDLDLACSITGLYRVLDLITEQGSGGLVDKIIISQDSLKSLINTVCPGAYASLTKVNFKALDQYIIKPVGIYGSKEGIVRFLLELGVTDEAVAAQLLANPNTHGQGQRVLRSGLYILRPTEQQNKAEQVFVLYWPEENTWDDSAPSQVRRNRVTFMRYLTKMCDQIVALMSSQHSQSIFWNKANDDGNSRAEVTGGSRIVACVVDRTTEQEESIKVREGFQVQSEYISLSLSTTNRSPNQVPMKPILLLGETAQGFMTVDHQPAKRIIENYKNCSFTALQLGSYIVSDHLSISESLDDQALKRLIYAGLWRRFPEECGKWTRDSTIVRAQHRKRRDDAQWRVKMKSERDEYNLAVFAQQAVIEDYLRKLRLQFIRHVNSSTSQVQRPYTLRIDALEPDKGQSRFAFGSSDSYKISGARETLLYPMTYFTVRTMDLTEQDRHDLQLNPSTIPSPRFLFEYKFRLYQGYTVMHAQLLLSEKILLIVADHLGNLNVYLEHLTSIDGAIGRGRGKVLNRERIGQDFVLAFDESRRMLSIISSKKLLLHIFVHTDGRGFQAQGSSINLNGWYNEGTSICRACFVSGSEEILLVDSHHQARIFSLITMQFRPATLTLREIPSSVHSTPDGSCLLVFYEHGAEVTLTAYHWNSFGSTDGTELNIPNLPVGEFFAVTSLISRTAVHLLWLNLSSHKCQSYVLDITRRITEFMFRKKAIRGTSKRATNTSHNCLIDCHSEVWTRFPVLAAVQRETISSATIRSQKSIVFVTDRNFEMFAPHFSDMIYTFERTTKKPTGDVLKSTKVSAASFADFAQQLCGTKQWNVSQYLAGEWIVDFLCLIPIHIAVTKENRFVPLKDGVYSPELERSLLGAKVNHIVDSISFGWYESLFQSYMATKPVRVVSSMGEQSVGKSYALNHLVDTSFAGSAMRTTEGVWMSATPTENELIVALDFEGVHSIERSAQEDTLLVLFNTAITNLVLFRNNFVLSRDITGLFQSFQSSAAVLDPAANPSLFQSTLVIIIKDVVEADKKEIAKEFSLKFQRIVQDEQEANFITRLHAGKLAIVPWPVIESGAFYKLFYALKRRLDQQAVTHHAAGEFLHTMKALMAKLKANDWGAMSQTMASHRAQLLLTLLPNVLTFGFQEVHPELEPLKNFDTDAPIGLPDTEAQLFFAAGASPQSEAREQALAILQSSWQQCETRQRISDAEWTESLSQYLEGIANLRIDHVREWFAQNVSRFQAGHASIEELRRTFEEAIVDLKGNIQLCKLQCANCQLLCVQSRFHDGPHSCQTSHLCIHECDFCQEPKECSMPAGHKAQHICVVNAHLCGKACKFEGRLGCLQECTKVVGHVDEHLCAASIHACGKSCSLSDVKLVDGSVYSCPGSCRIPSDVTHHRHECEARVCSVTCQLCKRICSNQDHMHGLKDAEVHLCGQEHLCISDCSAQGICEIETAPQSIEATFTGKHETFQYTKYSQVAKRLKCVKLIPPGATNHEGPHNHSTDTKVVHFCETRCENCGYFCTLPLGHPQQEHETRHGSMSRARWTIDDPDDTDDTAALEVEGRRFSTNDEGTPMMCNLVCQSLGRHVHIDYCRSNDATTCIGNNEIQHIARRLLPDLDRPKDYVTHGLFWKRSGFKDPYSKEEQATFAKCDAMCSGSEHAGDTGNPSQPSYCTLPMFHPTSSPGVIPASGYISHGGHHFNCPNPVVMQEAYHVIFVADKSGSMSNTDRRPLRNTPASKKICATSDNRFGAVLSSLFSFWSARAAAIGSGDSAIRRDAYSVILFNNGARIAIEHDFQSNPDQLLDTLLPYEANGGTNYTAAIIRAESLMTKHWSTERSPVIIFLSDGECSIEDQTMQDLCRASVQLGKAVSFHSVSFGHDASSTSLRRMSEIAEDAQKSAPRDPLSPPPATVRSTYTKALDTVQLAETFLGIAESLRKPRGALMH